MSHVWRHSHTFWDWIPPSPGKVGNLQVKGSGVEQAEIKPDLRHFLRSDRSQAQSLLLLLGSPWAQSGVCSPSLSDSYLSLGTGLIWEKETEQD